MLPSSINVTPSTNQAHMVKDDKVMNPDVMLPVYMYPRKGMLWTAFNRDLSRKVSKKKYQNTYKIHSSFCVAIFQSSEVLFLDLTDNNTRYLVPICRTKRHRRYPQS